MTWTINLSDSSPFYDQFRYPGGEYQIRFKPGYEYEQPDRVRIICREVHGDGLFKLAQLLSAIRSLNEDAIVELVLPYLPYGRADRRFVPGDSFGLSVFANFINSMTFNRVLTLDAHSALAAVLIYGLVDVPAVSLIYEAISRFSERFGLKEVDVLFPDEGARKRYSLEEHFGPLTINVHHCSKKRDAATGKLLGFEVPVVNACHALIVDDICDGGGTFMGIAEKLPPMVLGLYVTHGIFSKGFSDLKTKFDAIYTTNSFNENISTLDTAVFDAVRAINKG